MDDLSSKAADTVPLDKKDEQNHQPLLFAALSASLESSKINPATKHAESLETSPEAKNQQRRLDSQKDERVIKIDDVDKIIGIWHKQEYKNLGVETIRLGKDKVQLDLKEPYSKSDFFDTLELGRRFSFNFDKSNGAWVLNNVQGLNVDGHAVSKIQAFQNNIVFWTEAGKLNFGEAVSNYMKAILDPLTNEKLRISKPKTD